MFLSPLAFAAGASSWSLAEYCLHRFVGHGPRRRRPEGPGELLTPSGLAAEFNNEHVTHHVKPMYFAPTWRKVMAAAAVVGGGGALLSAVVGPRRGVSFALGLAAAYGGYEVVHRRVHTHAPRDPYSRWVNRNHWHHHRSPRHNHGVTSPVWDVVFGTHVEPGVVKIPRGVAPSWLVDEATGDVKAEFQADYELIGPRAGAAVGAPQPAAA